MNTGDTIGLESADILQIQGRRSPEASAMRCDRSSEKTPHASINFIKKSEKFLKAYVFCCPYKKWHVGDTTFTLEAVAAVPVGTPSNVGDYLWGVHVFRPAGRQNPRSLRLFPAFFLVLVHPSTDLTPFPRRRFGVTDKNGKSLPFARGAFP